MEKRSARVRARVRWVSVIGLLALVGHGVPEASASPRVSEVAKREQTQTLMQQLVRGILGDASTLGYLSDMGSVPSALETLAESGSSPPYSTANQGSIGMGFNGPYAPASSMSQGIYVDAWGNPITLETSSGALRLVSAGPDRNLSTTQDNVVYPAAPRTTHGTLAVGVVALNTEGSVVGSLDATQATVRVYHSVNGVESSSLATYSAPRGEFLLSDLHLGRHFVEVTAVDPDAYSPASASGIAWLRARGGSLRLSLTLAAEEAEEEAEDDSEVEEDTDEASVICHKADGAKTKTMVVSGGSKAAHLGHGDTEGPCPGD